MIRRHTQSHHPKCAKTGDASSCRCPSCRSHFTHLPILPIRIPSLTPILPIRYLYTSYTHGGLRSLGRYYCTKIQIFFYKFGRTFCLGNWIINIFGWKTVTGCVSSLKKHIVQSIARAKMVWILLELIAYAQCQVAGWLQDVLCLTVTMYLDLHGFNIPSLLWRLIASYCLKGKNQPWL